MTTPQSTRRSRQARAIGGRFSSEGLSPFNIPCPVEVEEPPPPPPEVPEEPEVFGGYIPTVTEGDGDNIQYYMSMSSIPGLGRIYLNSACYIVNLTDYSLTRHTAGDLSTSDWGFGLEYVVEYAPGKVYAPFQIYNLASPPGVTPFVPTPDPNDLIRYGDPWAHLTKSYAQYMVAYTYDVNTPDYLYPDYSNNIRMAPFDATHIDEDTWTNPPQAWGWTSITSTAFTIDGNAAIVGGVNPYGPTKIIDRSFFDSNLNDGYDVFIYNPSYLYGWDFGYGDEKISGYLRDSSGAWHLANVEMEGTGGSQPLGWLSRVYVRWGHYFWGSWAPWLSDDANFAARIPAYYRPRNPNYNFYDNYRDFSLPDGVPDVNAPAINIRQMVATAFDITENQARDRFHKHGIATLGDAVFVALWDQINSRRYILTVRNNP